MSVNLIKDPASATSFMIARDISRSDEARQQAVNEVLASGSRYQIRLIVCTVDSRFLSELTVERTKEILRGNTPKTAVYLGGRTISGIDKAEMAARIHAARTATTIPVQIQIPLYSWLIDILKQSSEVA